MITVAQLIQKLQTMPAEAVVMVDEQELLCAVELIEPESEKKQAVVMLWSTEDL